MKKIGYFTFIDDDDELVIYSDDFINFYDKNGKILNKEKEVCGGIKIHGKQVERHQCW